MYLTRHQAGQGPRWAVDGKFLPPSLNLSHLLCLPYGGMAAFLTVAPTGEPAEGTLLPPIDPVQEVWAAGVTYLRSRVARQAESKVADVYQRVYDADRPELFFKSLGWRVQGDGMPIHMRADSHWNAPEPELTLVINTSGEIVGYCAGNDMSSRDIEGENPLYLPQAKVYNRSCALGPGILVTTPEYLEDLFVQISIARSGEIVYQGSTYTSQMKRKLPELAAYLFKEMAFPYGAFMMTGTGIVPPEDFSLQAGDAVRVTVGAMTIENPVD
jgi:2-dehydro-3-deoxy-D-arabinonate dehydratase